VIGYELQKNNMYKILPNKFNAIWLLQKIVNTEKMSVIEFYNSNYFIHFVNGPSRYDCQKIIDIHF